MQVMKELIRYDPIFVKQMGICASVPINYVLRERTEQRS